MSSGLIIKQFYKEERQNCPGAGRNEQERENIPSGRGRGEITRSVVSPSISDLMELGKRGPSKRGRKKAGEGRGGAQTGASANTPGTGQVK